MGKRVDITIDGRPVEASRDETILEAASRAGVHIPTLCHMKGVTTHESCGACMVEVEGRPGFVPACATGVSAGMVVRADTTAVRLARRRALELLLSDHVGDCDAPCECACPAHIDIPGFIDHLGRGRMREAGSLVAESVAFPGVLGRICPAPCETACRRRLVEEPVAIRALERVAAGSFEPPARKAPSGKRVAVAGAGIAGLTAAHFLLRDGHEVTLLDARGEPGGALRAIPGFRLPAAALDAEIENVRKLGARFRLNVTLGADVSLDDIASEFDAVLVATGAGESRPRSEGASPHESGASSSAARATARALLERLAAGEEVRAGESVAVVGSGRAGIDAARSLARLGAGSVRLLPSRPAGNMRAQYDDARAEGVEILARGEPERIEALPEGGYLVHVPGGEPLRTREVYLAPEPRADVELLGRLGLAVKDGRLEVDPATLATSGEGVFAAGAVVRPRALAVHSSEHGRRAARSITAYLEDFTAEVAKNAEDGTIMVTAPEDLNDARPSPLLSASSASSAVKTAGRESADAKPISVHMNRSEVEEFVKGTPVAPRSNPTRLDGASARSSFDEVESALDADGARAEAARCMRCDCAKKLTCELRTVATELEADPRAYGGERHAFRRETSHAEVVYEPAKCIRCGRCIEIAREAKEELGLSYIGRGFQVEVGVPFGETLEAGLRRVGAACVEACPTAALSFKRGPAE